MAKVIITNPTDSTVKIQILGQVYEVSPKGTTEPMDESIAQKWVRQHAFLSYIKVEVKEEPKEEKKEETEEVEEEVKEEKPKKTRKTKKK